MRSILGFLGVLLIPVSQAFAGDSSLDKYCGPNSPPQVCIAYADAALRSIVVFSKRMRRTIP